MPKKEIKPIEEMDYEQAFAELEKIVTDLESSDRKLDETMFLFERGQELNKRCIELLDKAELKVKTLAGDSLVDLQDQP